MTTPDHTTLTWRDRSELAAASGLRGMDEERAAQDVRDVLITLLEEERAAPDDDTAVEAIDRAVDALLDMIEDAYRAGHVGPCAAEGEQG